MTAPKLPSSGGSYTRDESGKLSPAKTSTQTSKPASAEKPVKAKPAAKKEAGDA